MSPEVDYGVRRLTPAPPTFVLISSCIWLLGAAAVFYGLIDTWHRGSLWFVTMRYAWVATFVLFTCIVVIAPRDSEEAKPSGGVLTLSLSMSLCTVYGTAVCAAYTTKTFLLWTLQHRSIWTGFIIVLLGLVAFLIRLRYRAVYGVGEIIVGISVGTYRFEHHGENEPTLAIALAVLTAGIYLVVRGCDNLHIGVTKTPHDPIAAYLETLLGLALRRSEGVVPRNEYLDMMYTALSHRPKWRRRKPDAP